MKRLLPTLADPGGFVMVAVAMLGGIGLLCIYVTNTHYSVDPDGSINATKQAVFALFGLLAAVVVVRVGYVEISRHAYLIFAIALLLLVPLVLARLFHTSFGGLTAPRNGAYRWINLPGYQLQPSEFMKVAYMMGLAWYLRHRRNYRRFRGLMAPVLFSALPLAMILIEPDLGTALLLVPILFSMLFMAGAKIRHLLIVVLMGVAIVPFAWQHMRSYQRLRIAAVLLQSDSIRKAVIHDQERYGRLASKRQAVEWAASSGYQLVHSKNAVGSGGVFGNGWGKGIYVTNGLLPDRHNDFVFSIIAHQWGLVGCLFVLLCYTVLVVAGVRIASATTDPFARLLAVGVVTLMASQVLINVGMTLGLLPITGMTLPFVSYGGSSLLSNCIAIGLLIGVSQRRPYIIAHKPFEYRRRADRALLTNLPASSRAEDTQDSFKST